jgi:hypothetical protein
MGMRKATLLKLYDIEIGRYFPQHTLGNILKQGLQLGLKHLHHQVRAIKCLLLIHESKSDLRPCWIDSHSDKEITISKIVVDGQCILRVLLHIACTASKGRGKNKAFAKLIRVHISICCYYILQALIELHPKLLLIESMIVEAVLFSNSLYLTDILLKELASKKEMIGLNV